MAFESEILKANIRAIASDETYNRVLTSCGNVLTLWLTDDSGDLKEKLRTIRTSFSDTVIGVRIATEASTVQRFLVVAFTTRQLVELEIEISASVNVQELQKINLYHWPVDCQYRNRGQIVILNAQNEVVIYSSDAQGDVQRFYGPEKCILYSGKLCSLSSNELLVLSGTVFTKVLVWSIDIPNNFTRPLQVLEGHDGVIFSLEYFNDSIISASDDRSIRIWKRNQPLPEDSHIISSWNDSPMVCDQVYYGHSSRIWKILVLQSPDLSPILVSAGEDSSLHAWSLKKPYSMIARQTFFPNNRIWTLGNYRQNILLGGSDGAIKSLHLTNLISSGKYEPIQSVHQIKHPKAVSYIGSFADNRLLTVSVGGNLQILNQNPRDAGPTDQWSTDFRAIYADYCALAVNDSRTCTILGSKFGHITAFTVQNNGTVTYGDFHKFFDSDIKIYNLSFVTDNQFLVSSGDGKLNLFEYEITETEGAQQRVHMKRSSDALDYELPKSRHRWASCGVLVMKNLLIVGDCNGSVFGFTPEMNSAKYSFLDIHGAKGVTVVKQAPGTDYVYSGGRNGRIFEFLISIKDGNVQSLSLVRTFAIFPDMQWIGGFVFDAASNLKYSYGFGSRDFMLWDVDEGRTVYSVECGGGHRFWDFDVDFDRCEARFCFTNKHTLNTIRRRIGTNSDTPNTTTSSYSSLPKKINCCASLFERRFENPDVDAPQEHLFVIAGENNFMQIVAYNPVTTSLSCVKTLNGHISNISGLKVMPGSFARERWLFSCGGRGQFMVWRIVLRENGDLWCFECFTRFLGPNEQLLDFDGKNLIARTTVSDVDVRFLDIDVLVVDPSKYESFIVFLASSDCALRVYSYDCSQCGIDNSKKIPTGNSCPLRVRVLPFSLLDGPVQLGALAHSDGLVQWFTITANILNSVRLLDESNFRAHHAGINAIDFYKINEQEFLFTSGGDDNTIKQSVVTIRGIVEDSGDSFQNLCVEIIKTFSNSSVHSCLISGISLIDSDRFVTASIDQKIVLWQRQQQHKHEADANNCDQDDEEDEEILVPLNGHISSIGDIADMAPLADGRFLICGDGFEVVRLSTNSTTL